MKKRDRDFTSLPFGASRNGESHRSSGGAGGGSPFSLSRFLPSRSRRRHHSKSRMSLDSDSTKSECSLASHNVTSTSLPAFHNNTATTTTTATPLNRSHHNHPTGAVATSSSSSGVTTTTVAAAAASLPSSSQALPFSMSPNILENAAVEGPMRECPVCMMEQTLDCFPPVQTCEHRSCLQCLRHYLQIEISESRINIACPECNEQFHPNDMGAILEDQRLMGKYEDFMLRRVLAMDPDTRWCPAPDCGYAVIATGCAGCPKLKCEREGCNTYFCYHCKQHWHPNQTCDAARAERSPNIRSASVSYSHESNAQNEIKPCPRCGAFIVKMNDGSCNHMTCAVCAAEFCWLCMKEISDLHYLSPSGCTFWGQKPWSRKKKILWQLGTLVGAPLGITLVAGIAVPAMIIAIPVWVGRKIHARYRQSSRHRRNLAITGGVVASILASPIVAGLAVGIGVPILLAYIYGVVPISLCRSGGCGVTTTNTGGVRFEFDEENEGNAQGNFSGDNQSETMPAVANPSIAPSIGDASLGMTNSLSASGSHMDRVGILRDADSDRDSASNRAIAGASLNGSLCGSTYTNKLEVQADVVPAGGPHKRTSFSSESANISLSEKSATVSFDEASLRIVYSDGHREAETGEYRDADSAVFDSGDSSSATTTGAPSLTSPHSPRPLPRGGATSEEGRHGAKCKKLTRFMDDVQTVTASSSAVVTGDSATVISGRVGHSRTNDISPPKGSAFPASGSGSKASTSVAFAGGSGAGSRSTTPTGSGSKVTSSSSGGKGSKGWAVSKSSSSAGADSKDRNTNRAKRPHSLSSKHSSSRSRHTSSVAAATAATMFHETDFPSSASPTSDISSSSSDRGVAATLERSGTAAVSRICSREATSGVHVLPEVDTDKPVSSRRSSLATVNAARPSSASDATAGQSLPGGRARSLSLSCSSLDHRLSSMGDVSLVSGGGVGATAAAVVAAGGADSEDSAASRESCSLRRYSYELAYCHGRISPSLFDEPH